VIAFLTVVGAPLVEELLFRGVIQRWLCQDGRRASFAILAAFVISVLVGVYKEELSPLIFAGLILAVYGFFLFFPDLVHWWIPERHVARGIYATALLFGLSHSFAWPTPVPLTVLGLGLGWLAYRTQSLVGSMVLHGLFNAVTVISLGFMAGVI
jgi:membrane protease YdiL (CAAX protease family)